MFAHKCHIHVLGLSYETFIIQPNACIGTPFLCLLQNQSIWQVVGALHGGKILGLDGHRGCDYLQIASTLSIKMLIGFSFCDKILQKISLLWQLFTLIG
jgi:hypothetical protein